MSRRSVQVAIVGGGIVGAACAAALARAGVGVTLIAETAAGGATAAAMGHIVVLDGAEAQFTLTRHSQRLWRELRDELSPECAYHQPGTLWVAADEREMEQVERKADYYARHGAPAEVLDAPRLAEAEPSLRPGLAGALRVVEDAVIDPPGAAAWLLERAADAGAQLLVGVPASGLRGGRVELADGRRIEADLTVNAAGCDSERLTPGLGVRPRKGQVIVTDRAPGFLRHQVAELGYVASAHASHEDSVACNVQPRADGRVLIGSSRQFGDTSPAVNEPLLRRMLDRAMSYLPGLGKLTRVGSRTGFRPATPDHLPLIGPWPDDPRLLLATGHEGMGITASLATGELIADHVLGRTPRIDAAPYRPERLKPPDRRG